VTLLVSILGIRVGCLGCFVALLFCCLGGLCGVGCCVVLNCLVAGFLYF
jgi:hypothetical protein